MSKHTKGEWEKKVHSWSDISVYAGEKLICTNSIREDATEDSELELTIENEANMDLIAAAPVMYEALKKLSCLGNGDHLGNSDGNRIAQRAIESFKE